MPIEDGAAGAALRIPEVDGVVIGARSEAPIAQHRKGHHTSLMYL
jgi:hypothetical protein